MTVQSRICPKCSKPWHSSGWQGPVRVRCDCGAALNLAEAQLDRQLLDEAKALAEELMEAFPPSESGR
jgi:hypothetical protein